MFHFILVLHVCACVCTCLCVCAYPCCARGGQNHLTAGIFLSYSPSDFLRQALSLSLVPTDLGRPAGWPAMGIFLVFAFPLTCGYRFMPLYLMFTWMLGIQKHIPILMLTEQAFYELNHLFSLLHFIS